MSETLRDILMYFVVPVWLVAGFADWLCHRASHIATTAGPRESLIHLLMFAEVGIPLLGAIFFDVNALVILVMIVAFFAHEATALWDVTYASGHREVTPIEQHVHSFLELVPLMALVLMVSLHWDQFLALFGAGPQAARFELALRSEPLPRTYVVALFTAIAVFELLPYLEELWRGIKATRRGTGRRVRAAAGGPVGPEPDYVKNAAVE